MIDTGKPVSKKINSDDTTREIQEVSMNDDSVYELFDFNEYPEDMRGPDRLIYQIMLHCHPSKELRKAMMPRIAAEIEEN